MRLKLPSTLTAQSPLNRIVKFHFESFWIFKSTPFSGPVHKLLYDNFDKIHEKNIINYLIIWIIRKINERKLKIISNQYD